MLYIAATAIPADMVDLQLFRNRTIGVFPHQPMHETAFAINTDLPVAAMFCL
jgi:hypothetical protein